MGDLGDDLAMYEESSSQAVLVETTSALASAGVTGYLGDHLLPDLPDAREHEPHFLGCKCHGKKTCSSCCWGFPIEGGILMKDWEAPLFPAAAAAERAAQVPWVSAILDLASSCPWQLSIAMSKKVGARLLDIAILSGNAAAAASLAKTCRAWPLRRWKANELEDAIGVLSAALWAGAGFQGLHVTSCWNVMKIPLLQHCALKDLESHCSSNPGMGILYLSDGVPAGNGLAVHSLCLSKIRYAMKAGWDLKSVCIVLIDEGNRRKASLLDVAILCGQSACAEALADAGVEISEDCLACHQRVRHGDMQGKQLLAGVFCLHVTSPEDYLSAAIAAASVSLQARRNPAGLENGEALCQVPKELSYKILEMSMEVPILDQLDLRSVMGSASAAKP